MQRSPTLIDSESLAEYPLDPARPFLAGRAPSLDLPLRDVACSRLQFRIEHEEGQFVLVAMSETSATLVDGHPVADREALRPGATITAGRYRLVYREDDPADEASDSDVPAADLTVMHAVGADEERFDTAPIALPDGVTLVIGRDPARADILLAHPRVSRLHARIERSGAGAVIIDTSSSNGTFVDGRRLSGGTTLRVGARIDIGPFALVFDGSMLTAGSRTNNVELVAEGVSRYTQGPRDPKNPQKSRGRITLLDDVSLVVWPREFVALLGPTGAGKSTLLDTLGGRAPADAGRVFINGQDVHACFDALKQDMAVVPQHATLHDGLTVEQALYATAMLRLPRDTSRREIGGRVDTILRDVGLAHRRGLRIGKLSGGQRRRAALANEVLSQPNLLFLDEVTSGLDEQADREMMRLFRTFADAGKTVVCVTHTLANVERNCHLVVFLAPEGKLAFVGTPAEALAYFGVERLGDIYEKLSDKAVPPDTWKREFEASRYYEDYVTSRMAGRAKSRASPTAAGSISARERCAAFASQFKVVLHRAALIQAADPRAAMMTIGQAFTVAGILYLLFRDVSAVADPSARVLATRKLLFLMAISSVWFGCNNAAREIVRERTIYRRERDVNLQAGSYLASKLALLGVTSVMQVAILLGIVMILCAPPVALGMTAAMLALLGLCGVSLGLLISSSSRTEAVAASLVPIVLIPQIVLAGLIAPLRDVALWVGRGGVSAFWGYQGLTHAIEGGLAGHAPGDSPGPVTAAVVLAAHIVLLTGATLVVLRLPDERVSVRDFRGILLRLASRLISPFRPAASPKGTRS